MPRSGDIVQTQVHQVRGFQETTRNSMGSEHSARAQPMTCVLREPIILAAGRILHEG